MSTSAHSSVTPADAVSAERAVRGGERADGGDQAGGHDLGVGDAAVDEDDEVAVLAAGQPVLAAQAAGEPGGDARAARWSRWSG